jgi:hypothetical protein
MKQYDCSSNNMTIDETLWLFIKQYDCWWNNMIVHQIVWLFILSSKFQVPSSKWYYKYPYNNIRKPNRRVCPSWLNLLHNRNPHLETLGGSVSFQCRINIFSLFIYKLHQQIVPCSKLKKERCVNFVKFCEPNMNGNKKWSSMRGDRF